MTLHKTRGFSITELMIVIAIIGILISIVYPALNAARKSAKKTHELSLISQVGKAWTMYSVGHQDRLLPGYVSAPVQEYQEVAWAFPDESIVPPAPNYDPDLPNDAGPWPWRLLDYLDNDWRSLLFYRDVDWDGSAGRLIDHAGVIATEPAFGYNGYYLGGNWFIDNHSNRPTYEFNAVSLTDERVVNVVSTVAAHIKNPTRQLVFCSTFLADIGTHTNLSDDTPGTYFAIPSILARVQKWEVLGSNLVEANFETPIPLGRFNGLPAICYADGHTESVEIETLLDQQLWISKAETIEDIPASEFSHTQ